MMEKQSHRITCRIKDFNDVKIREHGLKLLTYVIIAFIWLMFKYCV